MHALFSILDSLCPRGLICSVTCKSKWFLPVTLSYKQNSWKYLQSVPTLLHHRKTKVNLKCEHFTIRRQAFLKAGLWLGWCSQGRRHNWWKGGFVKVMWPVNCIHVACLNLSRWKSGRTWPMPAAEYTNFCCKFNQSYTHTLRLTTILYILQETVPFNTFSTVRWTVSPSNIQYILLNSVATTVLVARRKALTPIIRATRNIVRNMHSPLIETLWW